MTPEPEDPGYSEWSAPEPTEDEPVDLSDWPKPEVYARFATEAEQPSTCRSLARLALAQGWSCRVTYSRGTVPLARNRWQPGRVVDAYLLKAWRGGVLVVAKWETQASGKVGADGGWLVIRGDWPYPLNITQVREILGTARCCS